jgi:hypothetical protein
MVPAGRLPVLVATALQGDTSDASRWHLGFCEATPASTIPGGRGSALACGHELANRCQKRGGPRRGGGYLAHEAMATKARPPMVARSGSIPHGAGRGHVKSQEQPGLRAGNLDRLRFGQRASWSLQAFGSEYPTSVTISDGTTEPLSLRARRWFPEWTNKSSAHREAQAAQPRR